MYKSFNRGRRKCFLFDMEVNADTAVILEKIIACVQEITKNLSKCYFYSQIYIIIIDRNIFKLTHFGSIRHKKPKSFHLCPSTKIKIKIFFSQIFIKSGSQILFYSCYNISTNIVLFGIYIKKYKCI